MARRWSEGLAPVAVAVECSGARHRVVWHEGRLSFPDHDLRAEAVLSALGGEPCGCATVLEAWRAAFAAPELPSRGGSGDAAGLPAEVAELRELAWLASLERRWHDPALSPLTRRRVNDLVARRLRAAVEEALAPSRGRRGRLRVAIASHVVAYPDEPSVTVATGPGVVRIEAGLPLPWLVGVWAHRAAVVDGHVVLAASGGSGGRLGALLLGWSREPGEPAIAPTLRRAWVVRDDGAWRVEDHPPPPRFAVWWSVRSGARP